MLLYNNDSKVTFKKKSIHSKFSTFRTDFCRAFQLPYSFSLISLYPIILHGFSHVIHTGQFIEVRINQKILSMKNLIYQREMWYNLSLVNPVCAIPF